MCMYINYILKNINLRDLYDICDIIPHYTS